jgi:uncharacterized RDD family membrane protein YckC
MVTLDTIRPFETPEGVELELRIAGPVPRSAAWLIDLLIRLVVLFVAYLAFIPFAQFGEGIWFLGFFLIEWLYPVLFEVYKGQTPGKRALGLLVIHDNGTPISWPSSLLRNLLRFADIFPGCYGVGLVALLCNSDFKRLGDLAAGTLVIYKDDDVTRLPIPEHEPKTPPISFDYPTQRAILDYAERHERLSGDRSIELAGLLEEMTGKVGQENVEEVLGYANWLVADR